MDIRFVERDTKEWVAMWKSLAAKTGGDVAQEHPISGEVWQYMGTVEGHHQFRHRDHPETNQRKYVKIRV